MPVRRALALALACPSLCSLAALGPMTSGSVANVASMPLARDVLADRAEQMLRKLGYTEPIADRALGLSINRDYLRWAERTARTTGGASVRSGRPSPITFWYRTSPKELVAVNMFSGRVESDDPPMTGAGMHQITLDGNGRVIELRSVPPETARRPAAAAGNPAAPRGTRCSRRRTRSGHVHGRHAAMGPPRLFGRDRGMGRPDAWASQSAGPCGGRGVSGRVTWFRIVWPWTEPPRRRQSLSPWPSEWPAP